MIVTIKLLLILSLVISLSIGLVVLNKKNRTSSELYFGLAQIFISIWTLDVYFSTFSEYSRLIPVSDRLLFPGSSLLIMFFLLFTISFPNNQKIGRRLWLLIVAPAATQFSLLVATGSWYVSSEVINQPNGLVTYTQISGNGLLIFNVIFPAYFLAGLFVLFKKYRISTKEKKSAIKLILVGMSLTASLALVTNLFLVSVIPNGNLIWLGPIFSLINSFAILAAMAKYKLFDIRPAAARTVAYFMIISLLFIVYFVIGVLYSSFIFDSFGASIGSILILSLSLVFAAYFGRIKRALDNLSNVLFFKDSYDLGTHMEAISTILISEQSSSAIRSKMTSEIKFVLNPSQVKIISSPRVDEKLSQELLDTDRLVFRTSELTSNAQLKYHSNQESLLCVLRMDNKLFGYILLSGKKSGRRYSSQDIQFLSHIGKEMAIGIQRAQYYDSILQFNRKLKAEVRLATNELRKTNLQLRSLDKAKDEFFSLASHQLKSPNQAVAHALTMLDDRQVAKTHEQRSEILDLAKESSLRANYIVSDLLDVARLAANNLELNRIEFDLANMVEKRVKIAKQNGTSKNLNLALEVSSDFPKEVNLDQDKLREVVANFLDNAVKYTADGGKITIDLKQADKGVILEIKDNGIGVPKKDQGDLFKKFYRASNAVSDRNGTGLGLYLSKKFIELHNGKIIFKSTENKGSTFGFSIPLKRKPGK